MVTECHHILVSGIKCRRIAPRGKEFCPDHDSKKRRTADNFDREMQAFADSLESKNLYELLSALSEILSKLETKVSVSCRRRATQANILATSAIDLYLASAPTPSMRDIDPPSAAQVGEIQNLLLTLFEMKCVRRRILESNAYRNSMLLSLIESSTYKIQQGEGEGA